MIDIHPPAHGSMTRRDFFVHLFIVVLGILIAIGLEQLAELIHHHHERHQLEDDLREEAQRNVDVIQENQRNFGVYISWYRDILISGRKAKPVGGLVTFAIPTRVGVPAARRPMDNVWPAAKASGAVAVLSRGEIETFGRISTYAELAEQRVELRESADVSEHAILNRLGIELVPGGTVRMSIRDRDQLMDAIGTHLEQYRQLSIADARWQGASQAVLHGVRSSDDFSPYITRALAACPAR